MALIDTNIILYLIDKTNPRLTAVAAELLTGQSENSVLISDGVLAECFYVLCGRQFGFTRAHAAQTVVSIIQQPVFKDTEHLLSACQLFSRTQLDIVDCLLLARAEQTNQPILTHDKELLKSQSLTPKT